MLLEIAVQILRLQGRELHLLQHGGQRLSGQEALLLALGDDSLKLLHLHDGGLRGYQQTINLVAHSAPQGPLRIPVGTVARPTSPDLR